ncbi:MAG: hypothetical protein GX208_09950 [Firmicutes bacterium]|nr:hypothetical protein [Bacillota bacterium]
MKNKILILTRVLLKSSPGLGIKSKNKLITLLLYAVVGFAIFSIFLSIFALALQMYNQFSVIDQQGVILGLGLAASSAIILVFGITYIMSSFYFSTDLESFLPLPIRPREIIAAKFLVIVLFEYLITAFIMVPFFAVYGLKSSAGLLYYLYSLFIFSLVPVVPLVIAAVIAMLVMRFTNLSKHKDLFRTISGIIGVFIALGLNFALQKFQTSLSPEELEQLLLTGNNSLAFLTSRVFPTVQWAIEALLNYNSITGLINLLVFAAISGLLFILLLYFGELVYIKGVMGFSETSAKRKVSQLELEAKVKERSALISYTIVELKLLLRTPVYFLNCVLMNFLWPVFLVFPFLLSGAEGRQGVEMFRSILLEPDYAGIILVVGLGIISFIAGANGITATSISREGQDLYLKKYIPVSYQTQITAKVLSSMVLSGLGALGFLAIMVILLQVPLYLAISLLVLGWMPLLVSALGGILLDLFNPKLDWDTEQKAVKQNLNVVFSMLVTAVFAVIPVGAVFLLELNFIQSLILSLIFYGVLNLVLYGLVYRQGVARFNELA